MAAKIIKGGGDVPARSLAVPARAPQVAGDKKVIDKELFSARNKAEEILKQGQAEMEALQQRGQEAAEEAKAAARNEASHKARVEAVTAILAAYKKRGDGLAAARQQCLTVANGLVSKITGSALTVPPKEALAILDRMLKARRGKHSVVVALPQPDVDRILAHAPLARALEDAPEIRVEPTDGEGALKPYGGEIALDGDTATRALCDVLHVPLPDDLEAQDAEAQEEDAQQDAGEEEEAQEQEDAGPPQDEGTQALDAFDDDDDGTVAGDADEEAPEETDQSTGSLEEEDVAASLAEDDVPEDEDQDDMADDDVDAVEAPRHAEGRPATRADFLDDDDEPSTVSNARNPLSLRSGSVITGVERLPSAGRPQRVEGTRVEAGPPASPRVKPLGAVPLDSMGGRPPPAPPVLRGHGNAEERSGSMRAPPPPRVEDFAEDDDPSAATVAISREDLAAHQRHAAPARSPSPPPADPGTRVDVRNAPPSPATRAEISGLQRKPR